MHSFTFPARRKSRCGLTLTELAIVLCAMGLVMGGIWVVVSVVWDNFQTARLQQEVVTVAQNTRDYFVSIGQIACVSGADLTATLNDDNHRLIPAEMRAKPSDPNSSINHALNAMGTSSSTGSFRVTCRLHNGMPGAGFRISLLGLKKKNCMAFLMQFPVLTPELGVYYMGTQIGNTGSSDIDLTNINQPTTNGSLPMTMAVAANWCNQAIGNQIDIDFKLRN